jgi:hypothetical protein
MDHGIQEGVHVKLADLQASYTTLISGTYQRFGGLRELSSHGKQMPRTCRGSLWCLLQRSEMIVDAAANDVVGVVGSRREAT